MRRQVGSRYVESFEELVDMIKGSTQIDPFESAGDKRKRITKLLGNYELFCNYYFAPYCFAPFGQFHKGIQKDVYEHPNSIDLIQWSRGFAKSTHFGLFLPLFIKFNGRLNGMIVGSFNETMASEKLADLQANLDGSNRRIINDFGEQMSWGNWEDGLFKTKDDVAFYAYGKKQSPRGTRFKWKRPNYGLVDDLNDARQLKNKDIALEDKKWVMEELKPALWTREWWLPVAQNKFHDNAVTALLEEDEEIKTRTHRVNIVNAQGKSNWIENPDFSDKAIAALKESEGGGFIRERMNTPFEEGKIIKAEWMNKWVEPLAMSKYKTVHYLDPSYKATDKSDYKAWVLVGKTEDLFYDILYAWVEKTDSKQMWEHAYELEDKIFKGATIKHAMEANFIQEDIHAKELERVEHEQGRRLSVLMDRRDKPAKFERVETLAPLFKRGLIRFNIHQKNNTGMKLLRSQLLGFEKGSSINDDGPDALESAIWLIDRYVQDRSKKTRTGKMKKKTQRSI